MEFDVEAAKAAGLSEEEIQAAIAAGPPPELTEEIVDIEAGYKRDIPEPPKENQQSSELTFDVERAKDAGLTDRQIQEAIDAGPPQASPKTELTFDVERAKDAGLTDRQIQEAIDAGPPTQKTQQQRDLEEESDLIRGVAQYVNQMGGLYGAGKVFFGKLFGSDDMIVSGLGYMNRSDEAVQARGVKDTDSLVTAWDKGAYEVLTDWLPYNLGQAVGIGVETIAVALVGGLVGSVVGPGGTGYGLVSGLVSKNILKKGLLEQAKKIAKEEGKDASKKFISKEIVKALADPKKNAILRKEVNKAIGRNVALTGMSAKFGIGETVGRAVDEAIKDTENPTEQLNIIKELSTGRLATLSIAHTVAEFIGARLLLKPFASLAEPTQQFLLRFAKKFMMSAPGEAGTEVVQSFIERYAAHLPLADKEALHEYINAAGAGFVMPAPTSFLGSIRDYKPTKTVEDKKDDLDPEVDPNKDARQKAINDIIDDEKSKIKEEEEKEAAARTGRTKITVINEEMIKDLGIGSNTRIARELLNKDITDLDNLEMIDTILEKENIDIKHNEAAVDNFRKKIKRDRKKILKAQKEAQDEKHPPHKRQRTGARAKIPDKPKPPITVATGPSDTRSVDPNQPSVGRTPDSEKPSDDSLTDQEKQFADLVTEASEAELNEAGFESYIEIDKKGNEKKRYRNIKTKKPLFAKEPTEPTDTEKKLAKVRRDKEQAIYDFKNAKRQDGRPSEAYRQPILQLQKMEEELVKQVDQERQQKLFSKEGKKTYTFEGKPIPQKLIDQHRKMEESDAATIDADKVGGAGTQRSNTIISKNWLKQIREFLGEEAVTKRGREFTGLLDRINRPGQSATVPMWTGTGFIQSIDNSKQDPRDAANFEAVQEARTDTEESIPNTGETKQSVLESFIRAFGRNVNLAVKRGIINIVDTAADLPSDILNLDVLPANVKAIYKDGKAYFIADRIKASDAPSMLLHEIGAHYGLEGMLGKANYNRTVKSLRSKKESDAEIKQAFNHVRDNYPELDETSNDFIQEVIAYISESAPENTIFRRIVGYIKNFLSKLGMGWNVDNISVAQIQDMVQHSVRVALSQPEVSPSTKISLASKDKDAAGNIFYSPLEKAIDGGQPVALADQWKGYIRKKAAEQGFGDQLETTQLLDFIDVLSKEIPKIPKELLQNYIAQNDIKIKIEQVVGPLSESEIENLVEEREAQIYEQVKNDSINTYEGAHIAFDYNETLDALIEEEGYVMNEILGKFLVSRYPLSLYKEEAQSFESQEEAETYRDDMNDSLHDEVDAMLDDAVADHILEYRRQIVEEGGQGYAEVQRTGGENTGYTELIITVDNAALEARVEKEAERLMQDPTNEFVIKGKEKIKSIDEQYPLQGETYIERINRANRLERINRAVQDLIKASLYQDYITSHHDKFPNAILWIRYDIRTDIDGNQVMWVEELQSDWAEDLRSKSERERDEYGNLNLTGKKLPPEKSFKEYGKNRPFVQDTQLWMKLGVKTIIREAAELGVDKVAFLSPAQAIGVHNRQEKAAEVSYGKVLPGVIERVISKLAGTKQKLEIIDLRPGIKPTAADKQNFVKLYKDLGKAKRKIEIAGNKPFYHHLKFSAFGETVFNTYATLLMEENPGIRVEFDSEGKAKVYVKKGNASFISQDERYTNVAMESSYADFEAFIEDEKKEVADAADAFTSEEFLKRFYQQAQKLKPLLEKTKRLAGAVATDPSILMNDPKLRKKLLVSMQAHERNIRILKIKAKNKGQLDKDDLTTFNNMLSNTDRKIDFLKSGIKLEKLITQSGANPDQRFAFLGAPNNEVLKEYGLRYGDIYNAPPEVQKKINKYRPNLDAHLAAVKASANLTDELLRMQRTFVGLKTQEQESENAKYNTGEQLGFTMTPKLIKVAEAGQPLFAKQGKKTIEEEVEAAKSDKQKQNDKRKKEGRSTDDPADPFFKSNKTVKEKFRGFQNAVFGYDIGLYNRLKKEIIKVSKTKSVKESQKFIEDTLAKISIAQAVHAETLAGMFKKLGGIIFNPLLEKFEVIENKYNLENIEKMVRKFAKKQHARKNLGKKKSLIFTQADVTLAEKFISQAIVAKQLKRIIENNKVVEANARDLMRQGKEVKAKEIMNQFVYVSETETEVDNLIKRFDEYPEIAEIQEAWIGVKNNVLQFLLDTEVIGQEQFDEYTLQLGVVKESLDDLRDDVFIPLYREGQTNLPRPVKKGTKSGRGIFVPRKGSIEPVDNIFLNMDIFVQAGITQGIANKTALQKVRTALENQPEDNLIVRPVKERTPGFKENSVEVSEIGPDGKQRRQLYEYSNVMYAKATNGAAKAMLTGTDIFANAATALRDAIVLNPIFGLAQTFIQDMYSAMYASGLRYGVFTIPLRVLYEFPATILNVSKTHKILNKVGATGGYAFKQNDNTIDADINTPGFYNAIIRRLSYIPGTKIPTGITQAGAIRIGDARLSIGGLLNRIAMASDNSVRQAVYQQALMENKSQKRAIEMAFEIINFRKTGDHQIVTIGRQYIPFFGAALQALSVQGKVIQGLVKPQSGVTPTDLREARINFFITWASTVGITLMYNILMDDDEEKIIDSFSDIPMSKELKQHLREARRNFKQLDNKIRDRRFIIGDNGFHLTLRPDFYTYISKIMPEQVYQTIIAENQDAAKFWASMQRNAVEIFSLNLIPQLIRPMVDVYYNEDSRTKRPIVPPRMAELTSEMQIKPRTSEAAIKIGEITGFSPIKVDYFFRQYTGYTGGLMLMLYDAYFGEDESNPSRKNKPAETPRDYLARVPGMSNFMSRDRDNRTTANYYELKNQTSKIAAKFRVLDASPHPEDQLKAQEFLNEGNNRKLYYAHKRIEKIQTTLTKIRKERTRIHNYPANSVYDGRRMTSELKRLLLKDMDNQEVASLHTIHNLRLDIYGTNPFYNKESGEILPGFDAYDIFSGN